MAAPFTGTLVTTLDDALGPIIAFSGGFCGAGWLSFTKHMNNFY